MNDVQTYELMLLAERVAVALESIAKSLEAAELNDPIALINKSLAEEGLVPGPDGLYHQPSAPANPEVEEQQKLTINRPQLLDDEAAELFELQQKHPGVPVEELWRFRTSRPRTVFRGDLTPG